MHICDDVKVFSETYFVFFNSGTIYLNCVCVFAVIPQLCEDKNGGCEHFCDVIQRRIHCFCADGYFLASDDKSCHSNGERGLRMWIVFYSDGRTVKEHLDHRSDFGNHNVEIFWSQNSTSHYHTNSFRNVQMWCHQQQSRSDCFLVWEEKHNRGEHN